MTWSNLNVESCSENLCQRYQPPKARLRVAPAVTAWLVSPGVPPGGTTVANESQGIPSAFSALSLAKSCRRCLPVLRKHFAASRAACTALSTSGHPSHAGSTEALLCRHSGLDMVSGAPWGCHTRIVAGSISSMPIARRVVAPAAECPCRRASASEGQGAMTFPCDPGTRRPAAGQASIRVA